MCQDNVKKIDDWAIGDEIAGRADLDLETARGRVRRLPMEKCVRSRVYLGAAHGTIRICETKKLREFRSHSCSHSFDLWEEARTIVGRNRDA
jgi:hypothetical protein